MNRAELRRDLLGMVEHDLSVRAELVAEGSLFDGYHPRMQAVHAAHAARFMAIMDVVGWPGEAQVGRDGAEAAWLIVQHAIAQRPAAAESQERPPVDWGARQRELEAWLRAAGWRA